MKKIIITLFILLTICISGCSKVVETKTVDTTGTVLSAKCVTGYPQTTYINSGGTLVPITTTASDEHIVVIEIEGEKFKFDNSSYYAICKDKVGEEVNCRVVINYYNDGVKRAYIEDIY